jgi:hypothetical protein
MKFYDSTGREVEINELDGSYDEGYIANANYLDLPVDATDEQLEVPDNELEYLTQKYSEYISEEIYQKMVGQAEDAFEGDR